MVLWYGFLEEVGFPADDQQQASFGSQLARWDLTFCPMTLF
jgi:hypothetical protein